MNQAARPVADVSVSGWTPEPVCAQINEAVANDGTMVSSQENPEGDTFEVDFPVLAKPVAGEHTLTVRMRRTPGADVSVKVSLRMGVGGAVATRIFKPTDSFADYSFELTDGEQAAITNYADLRLNVSAGPTKGCGLCAAAPLQWKFKLEGFVNASCTNCNVLNGWHTLTYTGKDEGGVADCVNACTWDSGGPGLLGNLDFCEDRVGMRWFLLNKNFNGFNGWHLTFAQSCANLAAGGFGLDYIYNDPGNPFKCLEKNVFTPNLTIGPAGCSSPPSTITVCPV